MLIDNVIKYVYLIFVNVFMIFVNVVVNNVKEFCWFDLRVFGGKEFMFGDFGDGVFVKYIVLKLGICIYLEGFMLI